jgi:hypothetical protein
MAFMKSKEQPFKKRLSEPAPEIDRLTSAASVYEREADHLVDGL